MTNIDKEISEKQQQLDSYISAINNEKIRQAEVEKKTKEVVKAIDLKQIELNKVTEEIVSRGDVIKKLGEDLYTERKKLKAENEKTIEIEKENKEKQAQIDLLNLEISKKNKMFFDLEAAIKKETKKVEQINTDIEKKEEDLKELKDAVHKAKMILEDMEKSIDANGDVVEKQSSELRLQAEKIRDNDIRIDELRKTILSIEKEKNKAEQQIQAVVNSGNKEIEKVRKEKEESIDELDAFKKEVEAQKLQYAIKFRDIDQKELKLKTLYENAGLKWE